MWQNQIDQFRERIGITPDGINSHEHIHFFPPYFSVALELSQKNNIGYIRFGRKGMIRTGKSHISRIMSANWSWNKKRFMDTNVSSSDYLVGLDWLEDLHNFQLNAPAGSIEIVAHPERDAEFALLQKADLT